MENFNLNRERQKDELATPLVALIISAQNMMSSHSLNGIAKLQVHTLSPSHAIRCFTAYATMRKARITQLGHARVRSRRSHPHSLFPHNWPTRHRRPPQRLVSWKKKQLNFTLPKFVMNQGFTFIQDKGPVKHEWSSNICTTRFRVQCYSCLKVSFPYIHSTAA